MKKILILILLLLFTESIYRAPRDKSFLYALPIKPKIDIYKLDLNYTNFLIVCDSFDIKHGNIVYAQAVLESGYFTSNLYLTKNNFLGLYNSAKKQYHDFEHWVDCLLEYKVKVQNKWDEQEDYFIFLKNLPYAQDPDYTYKLKQIIKRDELY